MPNGNSKAKQATVALFWISLVLLAIVVGLSIWAIVVCARSKEGFDGAAARAAAPLEQVSEEDVACANLYACGPQNTITRTLDCVDPSDPTKTLPADRCKGITPPTSTYTCGSLPPCANWAQDCSGCPKCLPSGGTQQKCATPSCPAGDYCIGVQPPPSTCSAPPCATWLPGCGSCSAACGETGTKTCTPTCPAGDYCDPADKPPEGSQSCTGPVCEFLPQLWESNCDKGGSICDLETQKCDGTTQKCITPRPGWCNTKTPVGCSTTTPCACCLSGDAATGGVPCPGAPSSCSTEGPCMMKNVTTTS